MDVLGIGVAVRDTAVWLEHFPAPDEKLPVLALAEHGGGPVPTALVTLARLGVSCGLVGAVGDDAAGRAVRAELEAEGVDCAGLVALPGVETPRSVVLVVGERRTICEWRQGEVPLEPAHLEPVAHALERCRFLLVDARAPRAQVEAARRVRAAGGRVVLDAGHHRPGVDALLPQTDVAVLSHTFPASAPGAPREPERFLAWLAERVAPDGPRVVGLTLGREGCLVGDAQTATTRVGGHEVDVVDTTGAGDVFHGALVAALLAGEPLVRAARFANAAAALKCTGRGGRAPLPGLGALRELAGL